MLVGIAAGSTELALDTRFHKIHSAKRALAPSIGLLTDNLPLMNAPPQRPYHVLFLCTGNSARSVLAEALLNHHGKGEFAGFSAGSFPKGQVHPVALRLLESLRLPTAGLRSKSWNEFAGPAAPRIDFIFTVCDNAAGEVCPVWPGKPVTAHWGFEDPAAFEGTDEAKRAKFHDIYRQILTRVRLLVSLPIERLDHLTLETQLRSIGKTTDDVRA